MCYLLNYKLLDNRISQNITLFLFYLKVLQVKGFDFQLDKLRLIDK